MERRKMQPSIEDDLASALAILRDLNQGFSPRELHLDDQDMKEFYTRAVSRIEPDPDKRREEWDCEYLIP
jgi:hypothetical protein